MPRRITRTITTAIAIAALAAPTALARPADMPPAVAKAAAEQAKQAQEFPTRPIVDRPSYPPNALPQVTQTPVAPTPADEASTPWTAIGLGIAGSLLAIAAIAGITRRAGRTRITA
jgi:hypothetical protein